VCLCNLDDSVAFWHHYLELHYFLSFVGGFHSLIFVIFVNLHVFEVHQYGIIQPHFK